MSDDAAVDAATRQSGNSREAKLAMLIRGSSAGTDIIQGLRKPHEGTNDEATKKNRASRENEHRLMMMTGENSTMSDQAKREKGL